MDQDTLDQIAEFIWPGASGTAEMDPLPDDDWAGPGFTQRNEDSRS